MGMYYFVHKARSYMGLCLKYNIADHLDLGDFYKHCMAVHTLYLDLMPHHGSVLRSLRFPFADKLIHSKYIQEVDTGSKRTTRYVVRNTWPRSMLEQQKHGHFVEPHYYHTCPYFK